MSPNILLLSIQHQYASMIFDGDKQVELRRVRPRHLREGDLILVYVTSPEKALFGVLEVEKVVEMVPEKLWQLVEDKAGISYESFQKYYENASVGFAIFLGKTFSFDSPIKLERLREKWVDFRPPQCYRYLKDKELNLVQSIAQHDILSLSNKPKAYQIELLPQK
ncbi:ASCH domain-containing protein [Iningainema tapete]|uniref:ASCH domain-containing protein n=1 Tax=Iningainema tapete BLCC-T55 TaxID=2748662 RepID=A0A8J7BZ64_9CYAN|nr:ASCH domain-containing protein [Iningainema tapete]MBD2776957.1 ASCH domain-containing protein [Iningainema tapete BLCC-T55]